MDKRDKSMTVRMENINVKYMYKTICLQINNKKMR